VLCCVTAVILNDIEQFLRMSVGLGLGLGLVCVRSYVANVNV